MITTYDFSFLIFVYVFSFLMLIVLILLIILLLFELFFVKKITIKFVKLFLVGFLSICLYLSAPWWFYAFALKNFDSEQTSVKLYNWAIKISPFTSVKSYMQSALGSHYYILSHNGAAAIEAYEKALEIDGKSYLCFIKNPDRNTQCKDYIYMDMFYLCDLYTIKGDTQKGIKICSLRGLPTSVVANYIINDDLSGALTAINNQIEHRKYGNYESGVFYAIRGNIYDNLGKNKEAQEDYKTALSFHKGRYKIKQIIKNKNYYKDLYKKRKKEYGL